MRLSRNEQIAHVGIYIILILLALAFLILIGVMLLAEAFGQHIPRGYIYFAMAFSLCVELINLRVRKSETKVQLRRERDDRVDRGRGCAEKNRGRCGEQRRDRRD